MQMAADIAASSKDRSRKVGCVIVSPQCDVRATGYNGFPRGVNEDVHERHDQQVKYLFTEHAERNAIYAAARLGTALADCTIYVPWYPCADCARAIIQAGLKRMVCYAPDFSDPKWGDGFVVAKTMLEESGVQVVYLPGSPPDAARRPLVTDFGHAS